MRCALVGFVPFLLAAALAAQEGRPSRERRPRLPAASVPAEVGQLEDLSIILGRPTDTSVTLVIVASGVRFVIPHPAAESWVIEGKCAT